MNQCERFWYQSNFWSVCFRGKVLGNTRESQCVFTFGGSVLSQKIVDFIIGTVHILKPQTTPFAYFSVPPLNRIDYHWSFHIFPFLINPRLDRTMLLLLQWAASLAIVICTKHRWLGSLTSLHRLPCRTNHFLPNPPCNSQWRNGELDLGKTFRIKICDKNIYLLYLKPGITLYLYACILYKEFRWGKYLAKVLPSHFGDPRSCVPHVFPWVNIRTYLSSLGFLCSV